MLVASCRLGSVSGRAGKEQGSCEQSWGKSWCFQDLKGVYKGEVEWLFTPADNDWARGDVLKLKEEQSRLDIREKVRLDIRK